MRIFLAVLFCFYSVLADTPAMLLSDAENFLYGSSASLENTESRLSVIEETLFGRNLPGDFSSRIDRIKTLFSASETATLPVKLNMAQWTLTGRISDSPALEKMVYLESQVFGKTFNTPFIFRLEQLIARCMPGKNWNCQHRTISALKLIRVKTLSAVSSSKNNQGDKIPFEVCDDVFINSALIIPKGSSGIAVVSSLRRAGRFGRAAYLELDAENILSISKEHIPVQILSTPHADHRKMTVAATVSALGFGLLGPAGIIGGAFVKGNNVVIPENTEFYLEVVSDTAVYGIIAE